MLQLLQDEMRELNEYSRHEMALYVTWFSFYLTLLLTAMGWSLKASLDREGRVYSPVPFFSMVFLFSLQTILAVFATSAVQDDLATASARIRIIIDSLNDSAGTTEYPALSSPVPRGIQGALQLMKCTLYSQLIFWPAMAAFVYRRRGKKLIGSSVA